MSVIHVTGSTGAVVTNHSKVDGEKQTCVVTLEGPFDVIDDITLASAKSHVPSGYTIDRIRREGDGHGFARMMLDCTNYGDTNVNAPDFITFKVDMEEVQIALQHHKQFTDAERKDIVRWLATDPSRRFDANGGAQWLDENDAPHAIAAGGNVEKFVKAYLKGIEAYNIYCPVIEKISKWKRLPGATMNENSTTGGTVSQFSSSLGTWNTPGITLSGFASTGYFKSGDHWAQGNNKVWTRTEQWTWTPDGSDSDVGWIYDS